MFSFYLKNHHFFIILDIVMDNIFWHYYFLNLMSMGPIPVAYVFKYFLTLGGDGTDL